MSHLVPSCLLLLAALAGAQSPPDLVGITRNTPLLAQSDHGTCTPLANCAPLGLPPSAFAWSGGSAYDGQGNAVWATSGQLLGRFSLATCAPLCAVGPCPKSSAAAEATGLDLHDGLNQLWVIDSAGVITRCTNACPPVVLGSCNTGLALAGFTSTTGIAIDELRGLVFYSTCDFATGAGTIYVALLANPCAPFQSTPTQDCFTNPSLITGLCADAGRGVLYWTNGRGTFDWAYTFNPGGPSVAFTPGACCIQVAPFPDPYTDLSIRWGGATSSGAPCANGSCPNCPMVHLLRNAPLLGTTLQLGLDQAPPAVPAWCFLGIGPCATSGPNPAPLCGPLLVSLGAAAVTLGFNLTVGPACAASTTFPVPLPANPALTGLVVSTQCLVLCGPGSTSMSNCLSFALQ